MTNIYLTRMRSATKLEPSNQCENDNNKPQSRRTMKNLDERSRRRLRERWKSLKC